MRRCFSASPPLKNATALPLNLCAYSNLRAPNPQKMADPLLSDILRLLRPHLPPLSTHFLFLLAPPALRLPCRSRTTTTFANQLLRSPSAPHTTTPALV